MLLSQTCRGLWIQTEVLDMEVELDKQMKASSQAPGMFSVEDSRHSPGGGGGSTGWGSWASRVQSCRGPGWLDATDKAQVARRGQCLLVTSVVTASMEGGKPWEASGDPEGLMTSQGLLQDWDQR